ncbi:hypothetical protein EVAR_103447_1 [Eumeta japonica]|uniref:Uncharacterized protein n=1 Tax=Eumeta variegata TaxID=151549 RepID=A0A4C1Z5B2_EUMVA|nr:hypothetical protein EVAR_103447_1 [Eumeta japonica]
MLGKAEEAAPSGTDLWSSRRRLNKNKCQPLRQLVPREVTSRAVPRPRRAPAASAVCHRLHADFWGPLHSNTNFEIIDAYSKWAEAFVMNEIRAEKTIRVFKSTFVRCTPCGPMVCYRYEDCGPPVSSDDAVLINIGNLLICL